MKVALTRIFIFTGVLLLQACIRSEPVIYTEYKPILITRTELENSILSQPPRAILDAGKIYVRGQYLFINEPFKGIHVVDNSNPEAPENIAFLRMAGNIDMSINNGVLLVDNAVDLVSIDISDIHNIQEIDRLQNVFPEPPPPDNNSIPTIYQPNQRIPGTLLVGWEK